MDDVAGHIGEQEEAALGHPHGSLAPDVALAEELDLGVKIDELAQGIGVNGFDTAGRRGGYGGLRRLRRQHARQEHALLDAPARERLHEVVVVTAGAVRARDPEAELLVVER